MSYIDGKWKDLIVPIVGLAGGAQAPTATTITGNINGLGFATGDNVYGAFEIQHDYKEGTDLYVHVHWSPNSTNNGNVVFDFEYTVAGFNATFPAATTISATQASGGVTNAHKLAAISTTISGTGRKIGDIICFRLLRNATGNTYTGTAIVHSIGIHYECDSLGSNEISTKN